MKTKGINSIAKYLERIGHNPSSTNENYDVIDIIIVVPSCGEDFHDLLRLRKSLDNQSSNVIFKVILVLNNDEKDEAYGKINFEVLEKYELLKSNRFTITIMNRINLPNNKKNGVGLARKMGMDEACSIFKLQGKDGIILCLDADCTVSKQYVQQVNEYFLNYPKLNAFSLGFEHPLESLDVDRRDAIAKYELHLRYFIEAQRRIGLPFAFQTVGSAMAVRASAYAKEGGMPVLKAGEDFYFLHKFIANNKCGNIPEVLVYPSGRISDRVPFGTGRAVSEILGNENSTYSTYRWESFIEIRKFLLEVNRCYQAKDLFDESCINLIISKYLKENDFQTVLASCQKNTTTSDSFYKRFFQWFNAFRLMKMLHYLRDNDLPNKELLETVNFFQAYYNMKPFGSIEEALYEFRERDQRINVKPVLFQESL